MTAHNIEQTANRANQDPEQSDKMWIKNLPKLLRSFGAVAILISLYIFLVRGWEGSSDLVRYLMLLGHTGLLTVIALASGHFLKEGKGARVLMMLSLVSAVVNFAILGAFILSVSPAAKSIVYPTYVTWSVDNVFIALTTVGIAVLLLLPVIWFGFRTLARGISRRMSMLFLFSSTALLLPIRDPMMIAMLSITLGIFNLLVTKQTARQRIEVKTVEGRVAILLQFLPIGVLLGRNAWLYSPDLSLYAAISAMAFIILRQSSLIMKAGSAIRKLFELSSVVLAVATGIYISKSMAVNGLDVSFALLAGIFMAAAMCYEISIRAGSSVSLYRFIAMTIATTGVIVNLWVYGGLIASILTLGIGIAGIVLSYAIQQRSVFIGSVVMVLAGLVDQSLHFFQLFDFGYWVTLAITGVVAILLGSLLEAKGKQIKQKFVIWKHSYSDWTY